MAKVCREPGSVTIFPSICQQAELGIDRLNGREFRGIRHECHPSDPRLIQKRGMLILERGVQKDDTRQAVTRDVGHQPLKWLVVDMSFHAVKHMQVQSLATAESLGLVLDRRPEAGIARGAGLVDADLKPASRSLPRLASVPSQVYFFSNAGFLVMLPLSAAPALALASAAFCFIS